MVGALLAADEAGAAHRRERTLRPPRTARRRLPRREPSGARPSGMDGEQVEAALRAARRDPNPNANPNPDPNH